MNVLLVVACALVVLLALLVLLPPLVVRALAPGLEAKIAARYASGDVLMKDLTANCFGLASRGAAQLRGNGALVLTAAELCFFRVLPEETIVVPRAGMEDVSIVRWHLGKSVGRKLLKVAFSRDGKTDSIAWYVADPEAWQRALAR